MYTLKTLSLAVNIHTSDLFSFRLILFNSEKAHNLFDLYTK